MISFAILMLTIQASPATRCSLLAWSNDPDPAGLRVHSGPGIDAPEIGRLPAAISGDDSYAPEFTVIDMRNGWAEITGADDSENPGPPRSVFKGTGWVHGSRIVFAIQSGIGRAGPNIRAPIVVRSDDWLADADGKGQPMIDCSGGWVRLRYSFPSDARISKGKRSGEAWFGAVCGNQHTTCDGLSEDKSTPGR
jgi:hypothetical protein